MIRSTTHRLDHPTRRFLRLLLPKLTVQYAALRAHPGGLRQTITHVFQTLFAVLLLSKKRLENMRIVCLCPSPNSPDVADVYRQNDSARSNVTSVVTPV